MRLISKDDVRAQLKRLGITLDDGWRSDLPGFKDTDYDHGIYILTYPDGSQQVLDAELHWRRLVAIAGGSR